MSKKFSAIPITYLAAARRDENTKDSSGLVAIFYDLKNDQFLLASEESFFKGMQHNFGPYEQEPDISALYSGMNSFDRALQQIEKGSLSVKSFPVVRDILRSLSHAPNPVTTELSMK